MIENKVKEDCILCHSKGKCWTLGDEGYKPTCRNRWQAELKTLDGWHKHGGSFNKYAERGDKIDEALYNYFLNILPPFELKNKKMIQAGFQCSEAIDTGVDSDNQHRNLYSTFGVINGGHYYLGLNFKMEANSLYHLARS